MAALTLFLAAAAAADVPTVKLGNAADPGVEMPAVGLGTGGYGNDPSKPTTYPECWSDGQPDPYGGATVPCGDSAEKATVAWLKAGGRRIDNADTYHNMRATGKAVASSGVQRSDIFLVSKIGSGLPMGANDTAFQVATSLAQYQTDYIDLVLIHWPTTPFNSTDPVCTMKSPQYDAKACRLSTWGALLKLWKDKKIRAVGVSNWNIGELQEIIDAGLELPSVNQCPFNPHLYSAQKDLVAFCTQHGIVFNSYSPLGIPDWHKYPKEISTTGVLLEEPALRRIADAHGVTPAQALLAWQWQQGVVFNPRTMNTTHMAQIMDPKVFSTKLSAEETAELNGFKADACTAANHWYECCGDEKVQPSIPKC